MSRQDYIAFAEAFNRDLKYRTCPENVTGFLNAISTAMSVMKADSSRFDHSRFAKVVLKGIEGWHYDGENRVFVKGTETE